MSTQDRMFDLHKLLFSNNIVAITLQFIL